MIGRFTLQSGQAIVEASFNETKTGQFYVDFCQLTKGPQVVRHQFSKILCKVVEYTGLTWSHQADHSEMQSGNNCHKCFPSTMNSLDFMVIVLLNTTSFDHPHEVSHFLLPKSH